MAGLEVDWIGFYQTRKYNAICILVKLLNPSKPNWRPSYAVILPHGGCSLLCVSILVYANQEEDVLPRYCCSIYKNETAVAYF